MNYIKELNAFREFLLEHELPAGAISLWHALMSINNKTRWKRQFNGPLAVVGQLAGLSKQGVADAREKLLAYGLIRYERGCPGKAAVYEMVSLVPEPFDLVSEYTAGDDAATASSLSSPDHCDMQEKRAETNSHHSASWMPQFAELLAGAFVSLTENRTKEKPDECNRLFLEDGTREKHDRWLNNSEVGACINRFAMQMPAETSQGKKGSNKQALFSGGSQTALPAIPNARPDASTAWLDPLLDQSADRDLTVRKQKQNKTKERQDRTAHAELFSIYEENIGRPGKLVQSEINGWIAKMGEEIVLEAIKRAAKHGGKTFSYVEKILYEWVAEGIQTVAACQRYQQKHNRKRVAGPVSKKQQTPKQGLSLFDELRKEAGV